MTDPKEKDPESPAHDEEDIDAALGDPNPKAPKFGDGGNLELWE